jgi:hypothetical protein
MTTARRHGQLRVPVKAYAAIGWGVAVVGGIGGVGLRIADPAPILPNTFGMGDPGLVVFAILGITWASVGAVLVVKRPENSVGRYLLLIGAAYALSVLTPSVAFSMWAEGSEGGRRVAGLAAWLTVLTTACGGLVLYVPLVFPDGRAYTPGLGMVRRIFLIALIGFWGAILIQPGPLYLFPQIDNPFGVGPDLRALVGPPMAPPLIVGVTLAIPVYVWMIVSRYRHAGYVERQQIKWFLAALGATFVSLLFTVFISLFRIGSSAVPLVLYGVSTTLIPVSIAIAILRYRLYDIDRIVSRTLSYAVVTGILIVVFAAVILLLQTLLTPITGGQTIAVAASTLAVFALFQPVLRRVRLAVDRRFDRAHYDAEVTVQSFAARLGADLDLGTVRAEIVATSTSVVRPTTAGVWIRGTR